MKGGISMAYAGIDIGTSGCKMTIYNRKGEILSSSGRTYQETGDDGYRELDANMVWAYTKEVIREASGNSPEPVQCIAVASLGESIICLDKNNTVLANSMLTGDKRGIDECSIIEKKFSKEEVMNITGLPLSEMYALPKFIWLQNNSAVFKNTRHIFFYEDYIGYLLTGKRMVSFSLAARSMAFDIRTKQWSQRLLTLAGLDRALFSAPVLSGTILGPVLPDIAEELGLPPGTLIAAGGHDQGCAGLGSGMTTFAEGEDGQGTCEVMQFILPKLTSSPYMIEKGIPCAPYVLPDIFLAQIELTTCGILMNWFKDNIFANIRDFCGTSGIDFFSYMDTLAAERHPGSIMLLPSFGSCGNPDICYDAVGTICGLTIHTQPIELYQAVKEGMAYQMFMAYETLSELNINPDVIRVTGGGAASDYTLQLRADIFNIPMEVINSTQAGTLGAAILAASAVQLNMKITDIVKDMVQVKKCFKPRSQYHRLYMERYDSYKQLYNDVGVKRYFAP
jgi:xylulokinase